MRCILKKNSPQFTVDSPQSTVRSGQWTVDSGQSRVGGFTFVEMIIVTAMVGIISLAIYKNIDSGAKIWHSVNTQMPAVDFDIFFDKFETALRNSFNFKGIKFCGTNKNLEFATLIDSRRLGKKSVGKMVYDFKEGSGILEIEEKDFSDIYNDSTGTVQESLGNLSSIRFTYYHYDTESKEYRWLDEWAEDKPPLAVRVELEVVEADKAAKFSKTVSIPVSA